MEKYLTKDEVAEMLRVSERTIDRLTAEGSLVAARIGGRRLVFRHSDIVRYVERGLQEATR